MKFTHLVKHNGIYYPAGADVPIEDNGGNSAPVKTSGKVEAVEEPVVESAKDDGRKYSEEDLSVGFMKLKQMAKKEGIVIHPEWKSAELKEALRKI